MATYFDKVVRHAAVRPAIVEFQLDFTHCMRVAAFSTPKPRWLLETVYLDTEGVERVETLLTYDKVTAVLLDREYFDRHNLSPTWLSLKDPRDDDYPVGSKVYLLPASN